MGRIKYQEALGLEVKRGRPRGQWPSKGKLLRVYVKDGLTIRETAARLGYPKDTIARALKSYGINRRPAGGGPSRLSAIGLTAVLAERGTQAKVASKFGVSVRTLRRFIRKVKRNRI
jgi:transposase